MPNKKNKRPVLIPSEVDESSEEESPPSPKNVPSVTPKALKPSLPATVAMKPSVNSEVNRWEPNPESIGPIQVPLGGTPIGANFNMAGLTQFVVELTKAGARLSGSVNNDGRFELNFDVGGQGGHRHRRGSHSSESSRGSNAPTKGWRRSSGY